MQLLADIPNIEKNATLSADWLTGPHFHIVEKRTHYLEQNDLGGLPLEIDRFLEFHAARRDLMAQRLRDVLDTGHAPDAGIAPTVAT